METLMLDIMEDLIEAAYSRSKDSLLRQANLRLEKLRYLFRLSHDLRYLSIRKYEFVCRAMNEVGTSIGGWLRYQKKRQ
jgi:hypothetical protein